MSDRERTAAGARLQAGSQWIEIDGHAYRHNLRALRSILTPGTRCMAVVKANGYGHGARLIARIAVAEGVDYLGVNDLAEHLELADLVGDTPVCMLGPVLPRQAADVVASGVEPTVSEMEVADGLASAAREQKRVVRAHIKIETGTHRQGILFEEIPAWAEFLRLHPEVRLRGLHTHYANIEDTTDHTIARRQLARLREAVARFTELGHKPDLVHSACSAAAIVMQQTHADLVRLGIATYGLWPSRETFLSTLLSQQMGPELVPVLAWKTRIAQIKLVPVGEYVGYGCSLRTTHPMRLAVLPVGYADGFPRALSGRGYVLIHGKRAPIAGRVCMNMTMIDITDLPDAQLEDEVILIGRDGGESISADTLATLCNTINYEIVARIGAHVPRLARPDRGH
ncbi:MAG: alanine racemase [Candidatus Eisenbacteria bacterium]|nr:alanine racemase [Candidatus Eisenbacteria bacterium]